MDSRLVGAFELERVMQRDGLKDGAQLVITVGAAAGDVETEINFGEGRQPDPGFHARSLLRVGTGGRSFLSHVALERFQLLLGFGHAIGFVVSGQDVAPFGEGAVVELRGALVLAEFEFDIGEMLESSGAVPVVIKSLIFPASAALGQEWKAKEAVAIS